MKKDRVNPELTERQDLLRLMQKEFHKDGDKSFHDHEPRMFLNRLTEKQIELLNSKRVPSNQLTAFITFGDGFFNRHMGAFFDDHPGEDSIRPNASFALFYKEEGKNKKKIELVFYTRFFVISYSMKTMKNLILARSLCRKLDENYSSEIEKQIFKLMGTSYYVEKFTTLNSKGWNPNNTNNPLRYGLLIGNIDAAVGIQGHGGYFPWIHLQVKSNNEWITPDWLKGNTIHGMHNTQGCWMLLRNFIWLYPKENIGDYHKELSKCYVKFLGYPSPNCIEKALSRKDFMQDQDDKNKAIRKWWWNGRNYAYLEFIHLFVGLKYNDTNLGISKTIASDVPVGLVSANNCWKITPKSEMAQLFYNNGFRKIRADIREPWAYCFLFKRYDKFTPDLGDDIKFDAEPI